MDDPNGVQQQILPNGRVIIPPKSLGDQLEEAHAFHLQKLKEAKAAEDQYDRIQAKCNFINKAKLPEEKN